MEAYVERMEQFLAQVGLRSPDRRFIAGNVAVDLAIWAIRPQSMFLDDGSPKSWSVTSSDDVTSSAIVWWMPGLAVGLFMGLYL